MASKIVNSKIDFFNSKNKKIYLWSVFFVFGFIFPVFSIFYLKKFIFPSEINQISVDGEGYYWSASQLRYSAQRFYGDLSAFSIKEKSDNDLKISFMVLKSKYLIFNNSVVPSFNKNLNFLVLYKRMVDLFDVINSNFYIKKISSSDMRLIRKKTNELLPIISELVILVHDEELALQEKSIEHRRYVSNIAFFFHIFSMGNINFFLWKRAFYC
jgi:hypothetical protein